MFSKHKPLCYILTIIVCLSFSFLSKSQTSVYHPFPVSNAIWSETDNNNPCNCPPAPCVSSCGYNKNYVLDGDTLIGLFTYNKIYMIDQYFQNTITYNSGMEIFFCGLRQDSLTKKVYCFIPNIGDTLLYDFNLALGDTLPLTYNCQDSTNYVSSIDSILIGGNYRKQFHISEIVNSPGYEYATLIEGIGSTLGLVYTLRLPFEDIGILNCFTKNNVTEYTNANGSGSCNLELNIKNQNELIISEFNIAPVPFSLTTTISTNEAMSNVELTIYNTFGQVIKQTKNVTGQKIILQRGNLLSGIYFLQIKQDGKFLGTKKIIIED